jgi:ribosomal protein S8
MQKQGLFSTVQVAGRKPPTPEIEKEVDPEKRERLEKLLEEEPWLGLSYGADEARQFGVSAQGDGLIHSTAASRNSKRTIHEPIRIPDVPDNPAERRIWLGLKYWNNEPVLRSMSLISKPKRVISAKVPELRKLVRGVKTGLTKPLITPGELMFVSTEIGILEAREALERMRGGVLLVRTS